MAQNTNTNNTQAASRQKIDQNQTPAESSNLQKDPSDWTTGDQAMTDAQASYLKTLSEEAGEGFDANLSKADASRRIDELQDRTGRH